MPTDEDMRAAYDALVAWGRAMKENDRGRLHGWEFSVAARALDATARRLAAEADDAKEKKR